MDQILGKADGFNLRIRRKTIMSTIDGVVELKHKI